MYSQKYLQSVLHNGIKECHGTPILSTSKLAIGILSMKGAKGGKGRCPPVN